MRARRLSKRQVFDLVRARNYAGAWRASGGLTEYVICGAALWLHAWRVDRGQNVWLRVDVGPLQFKAFEVWLTTSAGMVRRATMTEAAVLAFS